MKKINTFCPQNEIFNSNLFTFSHETHCPLLLAPFWCIQHVFYLDLLSSQLPGWVIPNKQTCCFLPLWLLYLSTLTSLFLLVCIPDKIYEHYDVQNITTCKINMCIMDVWHILGTLSLHTSKCIPAFSFWVK